MPNPYIVGTAVTGNQFYGREELIPEVLTSEKNCFCLMGNRRIGKTSFLRQLEFLVKEEYPNFIGVFWDLQGCKVAEETTARMKELYGLAGNHEVIRRTIISRIYYSAHHLSRYLLRSLGLRPDTWRRNVHRRVMAEIDRLFVAENLMDIEIFQFLESMRRHRVNADYQLHLTISEDDVEDMFDMLTSFSGYFVNRFDTYLNACRGLLEVIT